MVECQPSKLITRVRFPSPAPFFCQKWQTSVPVAQGIEQRTSNPLVGGSIPSWDAKKIKNSAAFRVAEFFFFKDFSDLERYLLTLVSQQKDGGVIMSVIRKLSTPKTKNPAGYIELFL